MSTKLTKRQKQVRTAIVLGLGKWNDLKSSKLDLSNGTIWCGLCDIFMFGTRMCTNCPLDLAGKHCLAENGYYDKFATNEDDGWGLYYDHENDSDKRLENLDGELKVETAALIDGMISDLELALKWFDDGGYREY